MMDAANPKGACPIKNNLGLVVRLHMKDDEIVKLVWEVLVFKRRFEGDPYSLSGQQIELLKDHDIFLHCCR